VLVDSHEPAVNVMRGRLGDRVRYVDADGNGLSGVDADGDGLSGG